jgi:hypothetical protein
MKTVIVLGLALCVANFARAQGQGIYNASINQAHRAVNATEAASQRTDDSQSQAQGATPAQPAPQPANPVLAATLRNIANLKADLAALNTNTAPAAALTNDLVAAANGTKASADTIAKLIGDLQAAVAGKPALVSHYQKLAQYLHALSNGAHLTPTQFQAISDDLEHILENGGASYEATTYVIQDVKVLAGETK